MAAAIELQNYYISQSINGLRLSQGYSNILFENYLFEIN